MDYTHKWNPLQDLGNKNSTKKTLELNQITAYEYFIGDNSNIVEESDLVTDGSRRTIWASDGLQSSIQSLASQGFISSLYTVLNEDTVYVSSINIESFEINNSTLQIIRGNPRSLNIFSDGTISTHTCVVYGSNTLIVQGNVALNDPTTNTLLTLQMSNGVICSGLLPLYLTNKLVTSSINNSALSFVSSQSLASTHQGLINLLSRNFLISTNEGLGTLSYISSSSLQSTVESIIINGGGLKRYMLNSTIGGVGTDYISSSSLISTTYSIIQNINVISPAVLRSTVRSLQSQSYISSTVFNSTINGLYSNYMLTTASTVNNLGYTIISSCETDILFNTLNNKSDMISTVEGIGISYISSQSLISSVNYIFNNSITIRDLNSSIIGLGSISVSSFTSTVDNLSFNIYNPLNIASSIDGLGYKYVSSAALLSTTTYLINKGITRSNVRSTVEGIGSRYISSTSFLSTMNTLLSPSLNAEIVQITSTINSLGERHISTNTLTSTVNNIISRYLFVSSVASTIENLGLIYISSSATISTMDFLLSDHLFINDLRSTVNSFNSENFISSPDLISSFDNTLPNIIMKSDIRFTVANLGTATYISSMDLRSTVKSLFNNIAFNKTLNSTTKGIGSVYVSTSALTSTINSFRLGINQLTIPKIHSSIRGLGSKYISSATFASTYTNIFKRYVLMDTIISTVNGLQYISTDSLTSSFDSIFVASNQLFQTYQLTSTVDGLGSDFISSQTLISTADTLLLNTVTRPNLRSTVVGLPVIGYVSTINLISTSAYIWSHSLTKPLLYSTVRGLSRAYISSKHIASSIAVITSPGQVTQTLYLSTFNNAGTYPQIISSFQLTSSLDSILPPLIMISNVTDTIDNLGDFYLSTTAITSTLDVVFASLPYSVDITSTVAGVGTLDYISTSQLRSTINYINTVVFSKDNLTTTVNSLGSIYISTSALLSTTYALDISSRYYPKWDAYYPPYPGPIGLLNVTSTIDSISSYYLIPSHINSTVATLTDLRYTVIQSNLNSTIDTLSTKLFFNMLYKY